MSSSNQSKSRYPKRRRVQTIRPGFVDLGKIDFNSHEEEDEHSTMWVMLTDLYRTSRLTLAQIGDVLGEMVEIYGGLSDDKAYEDS